MNYLTEGSKQLNEVIVNHVVVSDMPILNFTDEKEGQVTAEI